MVARRERAPRVSLANGARRRSGARESVSGSPRGEAPRLKMIMPAVRIRTASKTDHDAIWAILEPMIRAGETYPLPRDMSRDQALAYWFAPGHDVFVADVDGAIRGTYFLKANQRGGGSHVANCGYVVEVDAGGRGVGRAMCEDSLRR